MMTLEIPLALDIKRACQDAVSVSETSVLSKTDIYLILESLLLRIQYVAQIDSYWDLPSSMALKDF
jgi:hypothetical protein